VTQDNTYQHPRLVINGKTIDSDITGSVRFNGNNQLNVLSVRISNPELQNMALYNKSVELYLNNGSDDSVPIFRGFINDFSPSDTSITLNATDIRAKLAGNKGLKVTLTDKNNYDGYTLSQFITSYLEDFINDEEIGTTMLSDTSPVVFMTGERGNDIGLYTLITKKVKEAVDTETDIYNPLMHFIDIEEGGNNSSIVIKKDKLLTSVPSIIFSYSDGLKNYSYKRRLPANSVTYEGRKFNYTNTPQGISSIKVKKQNNPAETRNLALRNILISQQHTDEISINVTKGFDLKIGQIVSLDVDEEDIAGNHSVQAKTITFGKSSSCSLKLNKKPPLLKEYLS
jgi:hypothetical protein